MVDINLAGPDGNAFSLLAKANKLGLQLGYEPKKTQDVITDMQSSDYDHLVETFKSHFGSLVNVIDPDDKGDWKELEINEEDIGAHDG